MSSAPTAKVDQPRPRITPRNTTPQLKAQTSIRSNQIKMNGNKDKNNLAVTEENNIETEPKKKRKKRGHLFKKGVCPNPNGRPKGRKNKFSLQQYKAELATGQQLPLQFMLALMRNEKKPDELRLSAAASAAPYLHKKQPIGIEQLPGRYGSLTADQLRQLPTPALQQLLQASHAFYQQLVHIGLAQPAGEVIDVNPSA